jgi:tRNA(fMet)-specific endonuclease VapC
MEEALILETTYVVDLERELAGGKGGPAQRFLEDHGAANLYVTFTVAGELAAGPEVHDRERWERFLRPFRVLPANPDVCWRYGRIHRHLQDNGRLIGANDIWIAATALAHGMPLVTRNEKHFRRVPDLRVLSYNSRRA